MPRAPYQILVYLYRRSSESMLEFALFERSDMHFWQGIAGGGEDAETPLQAAQRETWEETGINLLDGWIPLDSTASIPTREIKAARLWGDQVFVIPQHAFGVAADERKITLSAEHTRCGWFAYDAAVSMLRFDSDRTALWELNQRLLHKKPWE